MKRKLFTLLLLAAAGLSLFISCSAAPEAVEPETDGLAYVRFGEETNTRSFTATYDIQDYDNLYWFYTATKDDDYGKTGVTVSETAVKTTADGESTVPTKGLDGTIGPFSQGDWNFTLKAYANLDSDKKGENLVYENDGTISATLRGGETKSIAATVKPAGDTGTLQFKDALFKWNGGEQTTGIPTVKVEAYGIEKGVTYIFTNDSSIATGSNVVKIVLGTYDSTKQGYPLQFFASNTEGYTTTSSVPVDYYSCKITAYINDDTAKPIASDSTFGFRIYGGATTIVSGNLTENPTAMATFDVAKTDIKTIIPNKDGSATITASVSPTEGEVTPSGSSESETTAKATEVAFDAGTLTDSSAAYCLSVEALSADTASNSFTITSSSEGSGDETAEEAPLAVYGSIKLTLNAIKDNASSAVTDFGTEDDGSSKKKVTVTTYIKTGLSAGDVNVAYVGADGKVDTTKDQPTDVSYDPTTGKVTFKTTHFSTFVVVSKSAASVYNKSQNRYYSSLKEAIENLGTTGELELKGNVSLDNQIKLAKDFTLDLGNKAITLSEAGAFNLDGSESSYTVIIKNGSIKGSTKNNAFQINTNGTLVIDDIKMNESVTTPCGIFLVNGANPANLEVRNSTLKFKSAFGISANASNSSGTFDSIRIEDSEVTTETDDDDNTALICNVPTLLYISDSTISGERQGAIIRGADTIHTKKIVNSTIKSTGTKTNYSDAPEDDAEWKSGNAVPLAAIVIGDNNNAYPFGTTVELANVKLEVGESKVRKGLYVYQDNDGNVTVTGNVTGTVTVNENTNGATVILNAVAKVDDKYYDSFEKALEAAWEIADDNERVIDVVADKVTLKTQHVPIKKSITINANGADFQGIMDLAIFHHESATQDVEYVSFPDKKGKVVINDAKNIKIWGNGLQIREGNTVEVVLRNCTLDGSTSNNSGLVMLSVGDEVLKAKGMKGNIDITIDSCTVNSCTNGEDGAITVKVARNIVIKNSKFTGTTLPVNISNDVAPADGVNAVIENCTFSNCGPNDSKSSPGNYNAPVRAVNKNSSATMNVIVGSSSFSGTKGSLGDILLVDSREGKKWYSLTAKLENNTSDINVKDKVSGEFTKVTKGTTNVISVVASESSSATEQ